MNQPTLEQQRAADAWQKAQGQGSKYKNLAKGTPALIMNSGLMQVMAFLHEKGSKPPEAHARVLAKHLRDWLHQRFPDTVPGADFNTFMEAAMRADPPTFQRMTGEAMAWLRWMRQMAAAAVADENGRS